MPRYEVENMEHYVDVYTAPSHGHAAEAMARMLYGSKATIKPFPANARGPRAWFDVLDENGYVVDSLAVREVR